MIEYIYFVKCPNCEDEHFSFFNEAKEFALGCLSQKPIITQVEVNRNDFGECTDSCDLGIVWSWEDMMKDTEEPEQTTFTKDNLRCVDCGHDSEFDALDNSVEFDVRKPIPDGMTIEQLVEEMEENEDEVECSLCQELFPKTECYYDEDEGYICPDCKEETIKCTWCGMYYDPSECRKEVDLGWLCGRCEAAIKSRGETLTFIEGNSWDLLDENVKLKETSLSDIAAAANSELDTNYSERDILDGERIDDGEFFDDLETQNELTAEAQRRRREKQAYAIKKAIAARKAAAESSLHETFDANEKVDFEYTDLEVTLQGAKRDVDDWDDADVIVEYTYEVDADDVATDLWDNFLTEEDVASVPGGFNTLENDDAAWAKFLDDNFEALCEKYYDQLLDFYRDYATKEYEENHSLEDYYSDNEPEYDRSDYYAEGCSQKKSILEELEDADTYRDRLSLCPECGATTFDINTGFCITCGFN